MKKSIPTYLLFLTIVLLSNCSRIDTEKTFINKSIVKPVLIPQVHITDSFWLPKMKICHEQTIPFSWKYLENVITEAEGLAANKPIIKDYGRWHESNLYKHLEAISYALHQFSDKQLETRMDSIIQLLKKSQRDDGYMYIYGMSRNLEPWQNLTTQHEGFCMGHLYEAASFYDQLFDTSFLKIAEKSANHAYQLFIKTKEIKEFPGHAGMELGLVELYRQTHDKKYLNLAIDLIERRGKGLNGWDCEKEDFPCQYYQDHLPFNKQKELRGHAVRAIYFLTGIADIAIETRNPEYILAAKQLWENVTTRKSSITGSIGALAHQESLGADYEIPRSSLNESCAAVGMANCAAKMLRLEPHAKHADILEKVLYNGILHGISLDGKSFFYKNWLTGDNQRGNWWSCCPSNLSRTLLGIGRYIYTQTQDEVFINLYIGNESKIKLRNTELEIKITGDYAWKGEVEITPAPKKKAEFTLNLRIPGWCKKYKIFINGEEQNDLQIVNGYASIHKTWSEHDNVKLIFNTQVTRQQPNPKVFEVAPGDKAYQDEVALQYGPFIYAIEGIDNNGTTRLTIPENPNFITQYKPNMLNGIVVVKGNTIEGDPFTAIPYYALANREQSNSDVWIEQAGKTNNSGEDWEAILYKEYQTKTIDDQ
jgi:DUF1680 family protein